MDIIDAYAHCGIRKYRPYDDLDRIMRANGVAKTVICEHHGEFDHKYIENIVLREPRRFTGAFLVDSTSPNALNEITRWAEVRPQAFRGIRVQAERLDKDRTLWQWAAQLGLNFVVDGANLLKGVGLLARFAQDFPRTQFQITHLGWQNGKTIPEHAPILALSERRNIHVQISGMHQFDKLPYRKLLPWITQLWRRFGDDRLLYGSNFPVMQQDPVYRAELDLVRAGRLGIPAAAVPKVMNANAARLWFS